jgi:voltage-gated potassium channel
MLLGPVWRHDMHEDIPAAHMHRAAYQLFMLAICIYALLALVLERFLSLPEDIRALIHYADFGVCLLFFGDFIVSFVTAPSRWRYFVTWGWVDLLSSIPSVDVLRIGRAARVMRIFRVLRGVRATKLIATFVLDRRAEGAFLAVALVTFLLLLFASASVLHFENLPDSNIKGPEDALWWAYATITTVGYGDRFPVSSEGRLVGALLMTAGVGLFGTFSGFVTSWFLAPTARQQESEMAALRRDLAQIRTMVEQIAGGRAQAPLPPSP